MEEAGSSWILFKKVSPENPLEKKDERSDKIRLVERSLRYRNRTTALWTNARNRFQDKRYRRKTNVGTTIICLSQDKNVLPESMTHTVFKSTLNLPSPIIPFSLELSRDPINVLHENRLRRLAQKLLQSFRPKLK